MASFQINQQCMIWRLLFNSNMCPVRAIAHECARGNPKPSVSLPVKYSTGNLER